MSSYKRKENFRTCKKCDKRLPVSAYDTDKTGKPIRRVCRACRKCYLRENWAVNKTRYIPARVPSANAICPVVEPDDSYSIVCGGEEVRINEPVQRLCVETSVEACPIEEKVVIVEERKPVVDEKLKSRVSALYKFSSMKR